MASKGFRWFLLLLFLGALGAGGYYAKKNFLDPNHIDLDKLIAPSATPSRSPGDATPVNGSPSPAATPAETPPPKAGPVDRPDFEASAANVQARKDVLKRVDKMPRLNDQQRAKLVDAVGRARNMGCIFIIPFQSGQREIGQRETEILANGFKLPAIQQLLSDPTVVFVVLGYADKQGDAAANEKVSSDRAQSVLNAMKGRCGVVNVMYGVGMGGSDMFDGKSSTKNRLVEIWAAFP